MARNWELERVDWNINEQKRKQSINQSIKQTNKQNKTKVNEMIPNHTLYTDDRLMLCPVISGHQIIKEASSVNWGEEMEKPTTNIKM